MLVKKCESICLNDEGKLEEGWSKDFIFRKKILENWDRHFVQIPRKEVSLFPETYFLVLRLPTGPTPSTGHAAANWVCAVATGGGVSPEESFVRRKPTRFSLERADNGEYLMLHNPFWQNIFAGKTRKETLKSLGRSRERWVKTFCRSRPGLNRIKTFLSFVADTVS